MSDSDRPYVLLLGDWERREFRAAVGLLRARTALTAVGTIGQAAARLERGGPGESEPLQPVWIVVAQAYPGRFSTADVMRLKCLAPLARLVGLLGSWCEGETRTGRPWPAVARSFWYQWPARFADELDGFLQGRCTAWGLPETAVTGERTVWAADRAVVRRAGTVVVAARSCDMADAIGDACRVAGLTPHSLEMPGASGNGSRLGPMRVPRAVAAVWEGIQCDSSEAVELAALAAAVPRRPLIALLDFPRVESRVRAEAAGATAVIGKPLQLDDLIFRLDQATGWSETEADRTIQPSHVTRFQP